MIKKKPFTKVIIKRRLLIDKGQLVKRNVEVS